MGAEEGACETPQWDWNGVYEEEEEEDSEETSGWDEFG